jgi:hypothetical protein
MHPQPCAHAAQQRHATNNLIVLLGQCRVAVHEPEDGPHRRVRRHEGVCAGGRAGRVLREREGEGEGEGEVL